MLTDKGFSFKLCSQAWVAALRHTQPEPRKGLMKEAFDLLVPRLVEAEAAEAAEKCVLGGGLGWRVSGVES